MASDILQKHTHLKTQTVDNFQKSLYFLVGTQVKCVLSSYVSEVQSE